MNVFKEIKERYGEEIAEICIGNINNFFSDTDCGSIRLVNGSIEFRKTIRNNGDITAVRRTYTPLEQSIGYVLPTGQITERKYNITKGEIIS